MGDLFREVFDDLPVWSPRQILALGLLSYGCGFLSAIVLFLAVQ